jgi:hypothetical protein
MASTQEERLKIKIGSDLDGQPVIKYLNTPNELNLPQEHGERLEWVRQSYECFNEKAEDYEVVDIVKN